jgi:hypothetical protein
MLAWPKDQFLARWRTGDIQRRVAIDLAMRFASSMQMTAIQRLEVSKRLHFVLFGLCSSGLARELPPADLLRALVRANPKTIQRALKSLRDRGVLRDTDAATFAVDAPNPAPALSLFHSLLRRA